MASEESETHLPDDMDSLVRTATQAADWTTLQHLMGSDQLTNQQKAKVIVETLKSSHVQQFLQHVHPFCNSSQLDFAMVELISSGLWLDVFSLSQCVGQQHTEWQLGHLCVHNHLLAMVAKGRWSELSTALQDASLTAGEKRWACLHACQRAAQVEMIENVLPQCADRDVDCVLEELVSQGCWWAVGTLFSQRRVISESQKTRAINKAAEEATTWELSDFILPHCTKRQLVTVSKVLVSRKLWWALDTIMKKDAQTFIECVVPACTNADLDSFMSHLMSACHWESAGKLLRVASAWKQQWQIGDASIHSKLIRLAADGRWGELAYRAYQSWGTSVLAWVMEEMSKRASKSEIFAVVVHMCPVQQISSVVHNIVTRGFVKEAARLLCRLVSATIEIWTKSSRDTETTEKSFWDMIKDQTFELKRCTELFTEVRNEKDTYGSLQLLKNLVWNDLSVFELFASASANQLLCSVLYDSAVHVTTVSFCGHQSNLTQPLAIDGEVQLTMKKILKEIRFARTNLPQCVQRLCVELQPMLANNSASDPVYALSVMRAILKYCYHQGLWSVNTQTVLSVLTTVPVVPEIQENALKIMLTEKKWAIIGQADLSYVGEQVRRSLFSSAVRQKQWSLVRQWADHTLHDHQRRWVLQEASNEKQWDVCLHLAKHGLTDEERTRVHFLVALNADWELVVDMYKLEADICKIQELLYKPTLQMEEMREEHEEQRGVRSCQLENLRREVECRVKSPGPLEAAGAERYWQVALFTLRQTSTADQVSLALKAAVAGEAWSVVMQLIRLGIQATDQRSLFLDMITHQQWGVCTVMVERGFNVEHFVDTIPKLMEVNQWTLVAKLMDCDVDDTVRRHVMQCAMQRKQGSVVSRCIMGMTQPLTVQEREDLFDRAVLGDTLQAVLPLVAEKDDTGVRHRDLAVQLAIGQQQWDVVDHCLLHQADINRHDDKESSPICTAAEKNDWDLVLDLAKRGVDPSRLDITGMSAMHQAIQNEKWTYVTKLIKCCSDLQLSATCEETRTPLEMLTDADQKDIIDYALLQDIDQWKGVNRRGETTLHTVCLTGVHDHISPLLDRGVSPLSVTPRGHSALSYAVLSKRSSGRMVDRCIFLGFSTHQPHISDTMQNAHGTFLSPILLAVMRGLPVMTQMLFESGTCSFRELFHALPNLQSLADSDNIETTSLVASFLEETETVCSRDQGAEEDIVNSWADYYAAYFAPSPVRVKEAAEYLVEVSTTPRSLKSICRLTISHCLRVSGSRAIDVSQLPISNGMKEYVLYYDLSPSAGEYLTSRLTDTDSEDELFSNEDDDWNTDEDVLDYW